MCYIHVDMYVKCVYNMYIHVCVRDLSQPVLKLFIKQPVEPTSKATWKNMCITKIYMGIAPLSVPLGI